MVRVLKDIPSSMSALSFAKPDTVIALAAMGVVAAGALVKISHDAWKDYKQEQHEKKLMP